MNAQRMRWPQIRWLALLTALLMFAGAIAFSGVGPLSAQTVTTTPTLSDTAATASPTDTATTTAATATIPIATDATKPATPTTATPSATPSAVSAPAGNGASTCDGSPDVGCEKGSNGGGPKNVVNVINKNDSRLRVKGTIQLNHIPGPDVESENDAVAYGSCTNCATFAMALQIGLISRTAGVIIPKNTAIAVKVQCSHCTTVARDPVRRSGG